MSLLPALILAEKKNFGFISSAREKILKNGFHNAKEHFALAFSAYHSAEISGILPFGYRLENAKREKKNGFQFKAYLGRIYRQMSVFPALISTRKKKFGLVTSATKKILKSGFHRAKEHFELHFSAYHSAEISGILHFQSRHEKPERDKNKRISFLCVTFPDLSRDVTFTGTDFGREKKFRVNKFG